MPLLAESLALLLLDDESGRSTVSLGHRHRAVGGAVLLDLARAGRITVTPTAPTSSSVAARQARVDVVDGGPTGDTVLDAALSGLGGRPTVGWAAENAGHRAWRPLLERLAADGAVRFEEQRVLGVLKIRTWPAADPSREQAIRAAITAALRGDPPAADSDVEAAVLIAILHGIDHVPGGDDPAVRARAAEIARSPQVAGSPADAFPGVDLLLATILLAVS